MLIGGATLIVSKEQFERILEAWLEDNNFCVNAELLDLEYNEKECGWAISFRERVGEDDE